MLAESEEQQPDAGGCDMSGFAFAFGAVGALAAFGAPAFAFGL